MLPNDVLLVIFYFYVNKASSRSYSKGRIEEWQSLVHVCWRWRTIVFGSPRRLNLRLGCTPKTPARDMLNIWPALPLFIWGDRHYPIDGVDNITAVLERSDRVCEIHLGAVSKSHLEAVWAAMQVPFPELTSLKLISDDETVPILPDSFLGGSAPRLEFLQLTRIPFPGIPKLLLSATRLVDLVLFDIPHSGYIPPDAMVTALSTLTSLRYFTLYFQSPQSRPDWASRHPPPSTRTVLPALYYFFFKGVSEYLEDIVSRFDAPGLKQLSIGLFNQVEFDTPQSIQFISRTPRLKAFEKAYLIFANDRAEVDLFSQTPGYGDVLVRVPCKELDWQISALEQLCTSCLPPLDALEDLYIFERQYLRIQWQDNIENALLLELLRPFTGVKNLYVCKGVAQRIWPALRELDEGRTTELFPALQNIFLEELQPTRPVQEDIGQFVARRQATGHSITVSYWKNALLERGPRHDVRSVWRDLQSIIM
jgi:hypothetical protein